MTSRNYMFTINLKEGEKKWRHVKDKALQYIVYQLERGETTGRLHIQGYLELCSPMRIAGVKKILDRQDAHIEKRKGTVDQAIEYCKKEATRVEGPWEDGKHKGQGLRSDLAEVCEMIKNGSRLEEVADEYPDTYVRNYRGLGELKSLLSKKRDFMTELHIIWGPSGSGKTSSVVGKEKDLFVKPDGHWWDGYDGEEAVLIDDVLWISCDGVGGVARQDWLRLADRYPHKVPVKGGFKNFVTKRIYITSMYDPTNFISLDGMKRRVTSVTKLDMGNTGHVQETS